MGEGFIPSYFYDKHPFFNGLQDREIKLLFGNQEEKEIAAQSCWIKPVA